MRRGDTITPHRLCVLLWMAMHSGAVCDTDFCYTFLPLVGWSRQHLRGTRSRLVSMGLIWRRPVRNPRRKGGHRWWYGLKLAGHAALEETLAAK